MDIANQGEIDESGLFGRYLHVLEATINELGEVSIILDGWSHR